jgi:hypothetical protein
MGKGTMVMTKKYRHKLPKRLGPILLAGIVVGAFLLLRLVNLTKLPVFADEAIYIRWAQMMTQIQSSLRFYLFMMAKHLCLSVSYTPLTLFPLDPASGRPVSVVVASLGTGFFIWRIVKWSRGGTVAQTTALVTGRLTDPTACFLTGWR